MQAPYVWQAYLDVPDIDSTGYHEGARPFLVDMFTNQPRLVLDIGCAAGGNGALIKQRFPDAQVWGIELNRAAAAQAAKHYDRVLVGKFEDFDLVAEGITPGMLDGVIVADVLEHMYNPWQVMAKLRPLMSEQGQVVSSIPNVRNLILMGDLAKGYWKYEPLGLLDITHIRFFTYRELIRFYEETGYQLLKNVYGIDGRLLDFYNTHLPKCPCDLDLGRMVLKQVTADELGELCSLQFYMLLTPRPDADSGLAAPVVTQDKRVATEERYLAYLQSHQLIPSEGRQFEKRLAEWGHLPLVHVALVATADTLGHLASSLDALARQLYFRVHCTVVAPMAPPADFVESDRLTWRSYDQDAYATLNAMFRDSLADWLLVLQAGDRVVEHSLLYLLEAAYSHPDWAVLYSDEDSLAADGTATRPYFKTEYDHDQLLALPYIGDFVLMRKNLFAELGGYDVRYAGAAGYEWLLRAHERLGDAGFGHVPDVLFHRFEQRSLDLQSGAHIMEATQNAVRAHLARRGVPALVEPGRLPGSLRVRYTHTAQPLVSIIVVTQEHVSMLQRCLETVANNTSYPHYELLVVDNNSQDPDARAYIDGLAALDLPSIRIFRDDSAFNLARNRNEAAAVARGEFLLFLDSDAAPANQSWLEDLLMFGLREDVGVVGPRLLLPDGTVDEAGRVLGLLGGAEPLFRGCKHSDPGYFGRLQIAARRSVVSASCMLVRTEVFRKMGGFDEGFVLIHADTDFCLRVRAAGLQVIYTPDANVLHDAATTVSDQALWPTAARDAQVKADFDRVFIPRVAQFARDPAYNPNFSFFEPFQIEPKLQTTRLGLPWKPLPRVLAFPADNMGCGNYRMIQPFRAAEAADRVEGWWGFTHYNAMELEKFQPEVLLLQRQVEDAQIKTVQDYKRYNSARLVFEMDDLLTNLPVKSLHRGTMHKDMVKRLRKSLSYCDRLIVSTAPLAAAYHDMHADIRVVQNSIDLTEWGHLTPQRRVSPRPRVGWAGGISHTGDLELMAGVIKDLAHEVDWVFFGMCPDVLRPYVKEFHTGVPIDQYPAKLASLNLDLGIAPLEINAFNECKSNLRVLEYGILGYPIICTDITPYQGNYPITLVKNRPAEWIKAIREHVSDLDECARRGDALREYVRTQWVLQNRVDEWVRAWLDH